MKIVIILFVLMVTMFANDNADIGFQYGFLSKASDDSNEITVLSDSSIIHTGDLLKINIGYKNKTNFYIVYRSAEGEYAQLYSPGEEKESNEDTLYVYPLHWTSMNEPPGIETFYFINSINLISELDKLMQRYDKAPPKAPNTKAVSTLRISLHLKRRNIQPNLHVMGLALSKFRELSLF